MKQEKGETQGEHSEWVCSKCTSDSLYYTCVLLLSFQIQIKTLPIHFEFEAGMCLCR